MPDVPHPDAAQSIVNAPHTKQSRDAQAWKGQAPDKIQPAPPFEQVPLFAGRFDESIEKVKQKYRRKRPIDGYD
jgi:hypothetical protein